MKRVLICIFAVCCFFGFSMNLSSAEEVKKTPDKGVSAAIADDAKEVKTGAVKAYKESKDAIVRDVKEMKEDIPRGLERSKRLGGSTVREN